MSNTNKRICRFCFKIMYESNIDKIEEITKNMLDVLLLKLNLEISIEPVMCNKCAKNLQKSFDFKLACINVINKLSPVDSSLENNNQECIDISEDHNLCQMCMKTTRADCLVNLYESKENAFILEVLPKHMPELNLNNPGELVICRKCLESLEILFSFVTTCLNVEERIREYVNIEQTNDKVQIELIDFKQFPFKVTMNEDKLSPSAANSVEIKKEQTENVTGSEGEDTVKNEMENINCMVIDELIVKEEEVDIKIEQSNCISSGDITQLPSTVENGNNSLEVTIFKCTLCPWVTKSKRSLYGHMIIHKVPSELTMFKCEICSHTTKYKFNLKSHMLIHKSPKDIKMHQCAICPFESKRKDGLNEHMLVHKNASEVPMYKCTLCSYETKFRNNLEKHMKVHKGPSELTMFECETCSYKTKYKSYLKNHVLLTHGNPKEVKLYKCSNCQFQTKYKSQFDTHIHNIDSPEIKIHKCDICAYETKQLYHLKRHMVIHEDPSVVLMHKCELCAFQTKFKRNLNRHMLTHRSPSEVTMYKCTMCSFESKYNRLKLHMLTHKNFSGDR